MTKRIVIIDLSSVTHAVKHSVGKQRLSYRDKPTFVIFGFLMKLRFLLDKLRPNVVVFATDSPNEFSLRKAMYPEYKGNRNTREKTEEEEELDQLSFQQFKEIETKVLPALNYRNILKTQGYEADDIIGSICKSRKAFEIVIVTSDADMYMLLNDKCVIFKPAKNKFYSKKDFIKEFNVPVKVWKRIKAISGCVSDNVKGIPGVGIKTVIRYYNNELPKHHKTYQNITSPEGKKIIKRNKKLVILPFENTPYYNIYPDTISLDGLISISKKYGFKSILQDIPGWKKSLGAK